MHSEVEIRRYVDRSGRDAFGQWLGRLNDVRTRAKILARIDRLSAGNFGDCKALSGGVSELRIDWGPGYRVYYSIISRNLVLLLCGGDKSRQAADIKRALEYLEDYRERE